MLAHRASLVLSTVVIALTAPAAAGAHTTAEQHRQEDSVAAKTPQQERAMTRQTLAATAADARAAAAAVPGTEGEVGSWSAPVDWPVVGVHVALLPNGKVLAYDSVGDHATESYPLQDHTRATVWDPQTETQTDVRVTTGFNIFCSGLAHLLDGSVFVAGGNRDQQLNGIRETHVFNPQTNTWTRGSAMTFDRWYPSVTGLPNGEMLITEGGPDTPEVRGTDGRLRQLTSAVLNLPLYPWLDVAPDGRAFYSGPDQTMRKINPSGTGAWQSYAQRDAINRTYGGHAMYDIGRILVAGGGNSTKDARTIDINGATPAVSATAPMAFGRRQNNLTLLADGTVLATGGNSSGAALVDLANGVYAAELWNPATGQWKTLAAQQMTRQYHSTALLLPDGRVLSSGGGICGVCDQVGYLAKNAEIFTPPYLYKKDGSGQLAPRPTVTSAPAEVRYGAALPIGTPDPASIRRDALMRLGAVTHSVDMDQRYVPLASSVASGTLTATAPANANVAPPGPYMLVVVDAAGVPSVAKMVTVLPPPPNASPTASITAPAGGAVFGFRANVTVNAAASDNDGTVSKVEFFRADGATKLGEDTTAPYSFVWRSAASGTHVLRVKATDNSGAVTTSAGVSIRVRGLLG
ncbi:MAG TPA: galactose oxidase-like domain-containing protein [Solirubrobacteraceae bacterium]|nr:galactose oxidase-like domain-containing protein [Solirubrobacteraceae bacterium]